MSKSFLPVTEVFYSIQGEGKRIVPSIFFRTGLCNFTCKGFGCKMEAPDGTIVEGCDSIRAVSAKFSKNWNNITDHSQAVDMIEEKMPNYSRENILKPDIVFTGGEPFLHWMNDIFQRTISHYHSRGHKITIETNAALNIEFTRMYQRDIMFSMSVKLSNSGEPEHKRVNIDNITNIIENAPDSYLKFVVSEKTWEQDWIEIRDILKRLPVFATVYLMPMGETKKEVDQNTKFVMEKCVELGFCYSDRLHIRAWDDTPGV